MRIDGFDLDNSPAAYTSERVAARRSSSRRPTARPPCCGRKRPTACLIGSFVNRRAVVRELAGDARAVHLVCAGTEGCITAEDLLAAGAIAAELETEAGGTSSQDDLALRREGIVGCRIVFERAIAGGPAAKPGRPQSRRARFRCGHRFCRPGRFGPACRGVFCEGRDELSLCDKSTFLYATDAMTNGGSSIREEAGFTHAEVDGPDRRVVQAARIYISVLGDLRGP